MKVPITGACGFAESSVAATLREVDEASSITGVDNLIRLGSETNLTALPQRQTNEPGNPGARLFNVGGSAGNSTSVAELTGRRLQRFGKHPAYPDPGPRPFEIPWLTMDSTQAAGRFGWRPRKLLRQIQDDITAPS